MGASIMQALDTTIAVIALPHMQGSLSGTQDQMAWVLTSYIVAAAIMTPLSGWLADRVGRKRVFFFSVVGFTIASALCGMADSLPQIVVFRFLQGIGGAALIPISQAVLLDINPPERHGRAMAVWGMAVVLGPIIGPVIGGWLTEDYSWRWVFYINVPFGILAALGVAAFMPGTHARRMAFDLFGFGMLSLAIGGLQVMLDRGELKDWFGSTEIWIEAIVAGLGIYLFLVHMVSAEHPFIGRALFKDRNFVIGNVFIFVIGVVLFATLALTPPLLQGLLNYPVLTAGLVTAPRGIGTLIAMFVVGRIIGRVDARLLIAAGFGLSAYSLWQMSQFSPQVDSMPFVVSGIVQGFGTGLAYVALTTVAFATLPSALRNEGTAFFNLMRNIGSSIGISTIEAVVTSHTQVANAMLTEHVTAYNMGARDPALFHQLATRAGMLGVNGEVGVQASWLAYLDAFRVMMYGTLLVIPLLLLVRRAQSSSAPAHVVIE